VTGTTAPLTVSATDSQQQPANITYTWSMVSGPSGAGPQFSPNGSTAAANSTVTLNVAGSYTFKVAATDVNGLSVTDLVNVTVQSSLSAITISPSTASIFTNSTQT